MTLRTPIVPPDFPFKISHSDRLLVIGSCFAENIGSRLESGKMSVARNPFGILYNPSSIASALSRLSANQPFTSDELIQIGELWASMSHHGSFSSTDRDLTLSAINSSYAEGVEALKSADYLIITLGTSWIYESIETGQTVGNCHKLPASSFNRRAMSVDEIVEALSAAIPAGIRTIITISPIRHTKDGLTENQLSKATLIVAAHKLCSTLPETYYFPAYEIMMDDLRDYRFYADDMVHPSSLAVAYIWENFCHSAIADRSLEIFRRTEKIRQALAHRPLYPETDSYKAFQQATIRQIEALKTQYPELDLAAELAELQ